MSKKTVFSILAAFVIAGIAVVWVTSSAAADSLDFIRRPRHPRGMLGQVTGVTADEISILNRQGEALVFSIDDNTQFRDRQGNEVTISDIVQDGWVVILPSRDPHNTLIARLVIILPDDFDPENVVGADGVILEVDETGNTVTLRTRLGEELIINLGADTLYKGRAQGLSSLVEGMWARILSERMEAGGLQAEVVRSTYPIRRLAGEITAVDKVADNLTIKTRWDQQEVTVSVDESTRYRSRGGAVSGLADLQVGMVAIVMAETVPGETQSMAVMVAAANPEDLPQADRRVLGEVVSVDKEAITVLARDGQEYSFEVNSDTRFRSRDMQFNGLEDIEEGMMVFVAGIDLGNGIYQALLIAEPPRIRP